MTSYPWKIYAGGKFIDSGRIEADCESDAMGLVLIAEAEGKDAETSYNISVGDSSASSYGDEFERTAGAGGIDDTKLEPSGHTFSPSLADVGIDPPDEMAEAVAKGMVKGAVEAICEKLMEGITETDEEAQDRVARATNGGYDGCGKTFKDCAERFNNERNFGGLPTGKCHHVFGDTPCGYDAAQPDTYHLHPGGVITPADGLSLGDTITVDGDSYVITSIDTAANQATSAQVGRVLHPGHVGQKYATGGIVQPSADVFGAGPTNESRMPIGLTPPEPFPLIRNDVEYVVNSDGDKPVPIIRNLIHDLDPGLEIDYAKLEREMVKSMGIPLSPVSIICGAPHCHEHIPVGHLPAGDTSGVPCPGCDATYTVRRSF
jgi:hypothetical protein